MVRKSLKDNDYIIEEKEFRALFKEIDFDQNYQISKEELNASVQEKVFGNKQARESF